MRYDIVIPHYNAPGIEPRAEACVNSICSYSSDYRIIWVQNGGEPPPVVKMALAAVPNVTYIKNDCNLGFVVAVNQGLKQSEAPFVVILNNDTRVAKDWLPKLEAPLKWPVMLSGPRTDTKNSWQGLAPAGDFSTQVLTPGHMLAFFCVMMDRRVLDIVGYLDEDFGLGFGDDDNYCARVDLAGLQMAFVRGLLIHHDHRSTFRAVFTQDQILDMQARALNLHYTKLRKMRRNVISR